MNYYFTTKNQSKIKALLILFAVICCCATGFAQWNTWCYKDFTTTGSQTFTLPANCDGIVVEAIGGGGAGGAAVIDGGGISFHFASAGGGGGAAYARQISHQNTNMAGQTLTIYVGKGGTSLTNGTITNGEASYVEFGSTKLVSAKGGNSVERVTNRYTNPVETRPGANGGLASDCIGSTCYSGGNGSVGADTRTTGAGSDGDRIRGGAGGGAAGGNGDGGNGAIDISKHAESQPTGGVGGVGNASGLISGANWLSGGAGANGTYRSNGWESEIAGNNYGGGGAGTRVQETASNNSHNGSAGAQGIVRVWYHISKNDVQLAVNPENPASCSGESVSLQASSSNLMGSASYAWSTGTTGAGVTVNPTTNTTYTVTLTDTYKTNCVATLTKSVTVTVASAFNAGAIASTGQTRQYNNGTNNEIASTAAATGGAGTIRYIWTENGTVLSGINTASYTPTATEPGTYVYKRFATDDACVTDSLQSTNSWTLVIENVTIDASISGETAICAGDSTVLTASAIVSQGTPSFKWLNTGETTTSIKVKSAGEYKVVASVTVGGITLTDTAKVTVTVNSLPTFTISTTPESCAGDDGTASVSLSDVLYKWSNDEETQEIEGLAAGEYVVTVTDLNGCKNTDTAKITLNNTLNVSPVTGPTVCTGNEFTIFPEASAGTTYSWPAPAPITGISGLEGLNDQPSVHGILTIDTAIITSPTAVSYTVTPKLGKCTGNAMGVTVTVTTTVSPEVTVTIAPTMTKCASTEVQIPVEFVNGSETHDIKWVLMGTTDTISKTGVTSMKDTLNVTLPSTCSAQYTYQVFYVGTGGCVANDGCVITVNSGTWSVPANKSVEVACAAEAEVRPSDTVVPTVVDGCGNTLTPTYSKTRYPVQAANGSWILTKADHNYEFKACDGTTKTWEYTTVVKDLAPEITCNADTTEKTDADKDYATMEFAAPEATDACGTVTYEITYAPATPANATTTSASGQYPVGTTTVTYTATDNIGQTATCSFTVTVKDEQIPTIVAPEDVTVASYAEVPDAFETLEEFLDAGGTASDNVKLDTNSFRYTETISDENCPKIYTRVYYIKDNSGNEANDTMLVVMNDNVKPSFTCPKDTVICRATADGTYDASTAVTGVAIELSDNNIATEDLTLSYVDLDTLPADERGLRTIRRQWTVSDECNDSVKIQNIGIYPAITAENSGFACPADVNETLPFGQCEMEVLIGEATYGEFFGQTLTLTNNAPADNIYPEGTTTVTWTLTDECGFSVSCDQTITVTFPECPLAVDADGNEYESVRIGCDCWTKRNLESLTYSDGTEIPGVYNYVSDVYPNEAGNVATFGRLYDWVSVIKDGADNEYGHVQGICPEGWYLPTAEKFAELNTYGADALKSRDYWLDGGGSNTTGFTSLPGGYYDGSIDRYINLMGEAYYWSASKVDDEWTPVPCNIRYICNQIIDATYLEGLGYSVRCIKEKDAEIAPEPVFECGTSTIEDIDGNTYNTVKIGDQCWMKESLKTTKYADGTTIPQGSTLSSTDPYWYYPDDNSDNKATYGLLYNWPAVMNGATSSDANPSGVQGICPTGWHVPSDAEWTQLTNYVSSQSEYQCGGSSDNIAKALASTTGWNTSSVTCAVGNDLTANNATGFSAVPAGYYYNSGYYSFGYYANFWSATQYGSFSAYTRSLNTNYADVYPSNYFKHYGFSVRCVKDAETAPEPVFECGTSTIEDIDGNTYNTVKIGDQCWMKENLKTTKYADGTTIPQGSTLSSTDPYWYYPDDNSDNKATYGLLYNWPAVMNGATSSDANPSGVQGICPTGWHVPSDAEWTALTTYVSGQSEYQCDGNSNNIAKALASTTDWNTSSATCAVGNDLTANNATGFSAVPAGYYSGSYYSFGHTAYFWSATQSLSFNAYYRGLGYNGATVGRSNDSENDGYSVRCLKD